MEISDDPILAKIEADMQDESRPDSLTPNIVWPEVAKTLHWLARATEARSILELGTGLGYATIWLARAMATQNGKILTIERDAQIAAEALGNIQNADLKEWVEFRIGNAQEIVPNLGERFDYIFMDIFKGHYTELLQPCVDVLEYGGILVAARSSWDIVKEYIEEACRNPQLETIVLRGESGELVENEGLVVSLKATQVSG